MSTFDFLHMMRKIELNRAILEMPSPTKTGREINLLEIGSGTGFQANILQKCGFNVTAIDLPDSAYRDKREFNIVEYDGQHLPCENNCVEIIFSSNVLEHIAHIDSFLKETHRVLLDDGEAIHILPTPTWRFWSLFTHYGWIAKKMLSFFIKAKNKKDTASQEKISRPRSLTELCKILLPTRHGERGNALTELYYFSERWWIRKFISNDFQIKGIFDTKLFYTNSSLFEDMLSPASRMLLAQFLGSSCKIYVLKKSTCI